MKSFRLRKSTFPIEGVYSKIPTLKVKSTFFGLSEERRATKTIRKTANERELFVLHKIWPILECALSIWFNNLDVLAKWPSNRGQCQRLPAFYSRTLSLLSNPIFRGFHTDKLRHPAEINLLEISFLSSRKRAISRQERLFSSVTENIWDEEGEGRILRSQDEGTSRKIGGVYPLISPPPPPVAALSGNAYACTQLLLL